MFDTRATEYGRAQRALCSGIEPSDPYTPATVGFCQLCASIETIRPTQITVGFREVEAKRRRYREAFAAGGQGNIRLCFASSAERLSKGLDRIESAIKAL